MNESCLRQGHVGRLGNVDALPGQSLDHAPVVQLAVIGIRVDVRQCQAVELRVGQGVHYRWFQILLILFDTIFNIQKSDCYQKSIDNNKKFVLFFTSTSR